MLDFGDLLQHDPVTGRAYENAIRLNDVEGGKLDRFVIDGPNADRFTLSGFVPNQIVDSIRMGIQFAPDVPVGTYNATLDVFIKEPAATMRYDLRANVLSGPVPAPGIADVGTAVLQYNIVTGEMTISANRVRTWQIRSDTQSGLNAAPPLNRPPDEINYFANERIVFVGGVGDFAMTNFDLGPIAQPGLNDLEFTYFTGESPAPQIGRLIIIPEPNYGLLLGLVGVRYFFRNGRSSRPRKGNDWSSRL